MASLGRQILVIHIAQLLGLTRVGKIDAHEVTGKYSRSMLALLDHQTFVP